MDRCQEIHQDLDIWKLLDEEEKSQCNDFLDMWGTWRARNSTITFLKITRHRYPRHKVDCNYTKHDINDYIQKWDEEKAGLNQIRLLKYLSTDEELREEVIPEQMKCVNQALVQFKALMVKYDGTAKITKMMSTMSSI